MDWFGVLERPVAYPEGFKDHAGDTTIARTNVALRPETATRMLLSDIIRRKFRVPSGHGSGVIPNHTCPPRCDVILWTKRRTSKQSHKFHEVRRERSLMAENNTKILNGTNTGVTASSTFSASDTLNVAKPGQAVRTLEAVVKPLRSSCSFVSPQANWTAY